MAEENDADEEQEGSDASGAESLSAPEVVQQRGRKRRVGRPVVADSSDEEHGCMLIGERTVALCAVAYAVRYGRVNSGHDPRAKT